MSVSKTIRAAGLLVILALALSACTFKPDLTVEDPLTDSKDILPFDSTATPSPSPSPTPSATGVIITRSPTAPPTPAPTATPAPTIQPAPNGNYQDWNDQTGVIVGTAAPADVTPAPTPYVSPTEYETLRQGMNSSAVADMQRALYQLGFYNGAIDGAFGAGTKTAVMEFQKANGLADDGIAGAKTLTLLFSVFSGSAQDRPYTPPVVTARPATASPRPTSTPRPTEKPIAGPSDYRYLDVGSTGSDVRSLQSRLKQLGYYSGSISGTYDSATSYAVTAFQQDNKPLWVDGKAGPDTQRALYSSSVSAPKTTPSVYRTLRSAMTGDDVYKLQRHLIDMGYMSGPESGYYDGRTAEAVKAFQQRNGLTADGIAGAATQQKLYTPGAVPALNVYQLYPDGSAGGSPSIASSATPEASPSDSKSNPPVNWAGSGVPPSATAPPGDTGGTDIAISPTAAQSGAIGSVAPDSSDYPDYAIQSIETSPPFDTTIGADGEISGTLRPGVSGEGVKLLQERLKELDYYLGAADGFYSDAVTAAVRRFQTRNLLAADGIAGSGTQSMLFSDDALASQLDMTPNVGSMKFGDRSDDVAMLQDRLIRMGYLNEGATGYYGEQTRDAVLAFQRMNGLPDDGYAGAQTLSLLFTDIALSALGTPGAIPPSPTPEPSPTIPPTPEPTPDATLREGDGGTMVAALKDALARLGYLENASGDDYDEPTAAAIKRFKIVNAYLLPEDGIDDGIAYASTQALLFSSRAEPWPTLPQGNPDLAALNNGALESREISATGTTQTNLSSGGIAALAPDGAVYYADGTLGGQLYSLSGRTGVTPVGGDSARFIHVINGALVYATDNEIVRYTISNGRREVIAQTGLIKKLAAAADSYYYLEGGTLYRFKPGEGLRELAGNVNDFYLDTANMVLYVAAPQDIRRLDGAGNPLSTVLQNGAQQVLLCDGVLYYRRDGWVYRIDGGRETAVISGNVTWFGFHRDAMYYITGSSLAVADTNGANARMFDAGPVASVSFINGEAYIGRTAGGGYNQKYPAR
ncbi:MAG: peptidoglycan-binding protein [Oscillospiraceae bacterium]|nr:peptidoglycan-binding protein [Oscillospiraceae bacterium]